MHYCKNRACYDDLTNKTMNAFTWLPFIVWQIHHYLYLYKELENIVCEYKWHIIVRKYIKNC